MDIVRYLAVNLCIKLNFFILFSIVYLAASIVQNCMSLNLGAKYMDLIHLAEDRGHPEQRNEIQNKIKLWFVSWN